MTEWELVSFDSFDGSRTLEAEGTDPAEGFFLLWLSSLRDSVTEVAQTRGGRTEMVPAAGFITYSLILRSGPDTDLVVLPCDDLAGTLLDLKKRLLSASGGDGISRESREALAEIARLHMQSRKVPGKEAGFFRELKAPPSANNA